KLDLNWPTVGLVLDGNNKTPKCAATLTYAIASVTSTSSGIVPSDNSGIGQAISMNGCAQKDDVLYFPFDVMRENNPTAPTSSNPRSDYTLINDTKVLDDNVLLLSLVRQQNHPWPQDLMVPSMDGNSVAAVPPDKNNSYSTAFSDHLWGNLRV